MKLVDFPISSITPGVANSAERVAINPQEVESVVKCGDDTNINMRSGDSHFQQQRELPGLRRADAARGVSQNGDT